jgi:PPOX class probable F420-dependent enzyme
MDSYLAPVTGAKTILLTTYKRDGTPVATAVSIAFDGGRAVFRTYDRAWKARRLRRDDRVRIAPATLLGKATGPSAGARAALLEGERARAAARALARQHLLLQGLLVPLAHRLRAYRTLHYELRPAEASPDAAGPDDGRADAARPGSAGSDAARPGAAPGR